MIINEELNFIFVHVPKTAGQAVTQGLNGRHNSKRIQTHNPLHRVDEETRKGKFAFGFIRNPWDRLVSLYFFRAQRQSSHIYDCQALRNDGFEKSLLGGTLSKQFDADNFNSHNHRDAMWWLEGCDFIGRFENINKDFELICKKIPSKNRLLNRVNPSKHGPYHDYYTDEMIEFVSIEHKETIDKFGYTFEDNHSV